MAFYYAITDNKRHTWASLFLMCTAMGTRPFNVVYLPIILYLIYVREGTPIVPFVKKLFIHALPALYMGLFFAWLNLARFGNVFEFGHNYLPEFTNDPHGQFYIGRVASNLRRLLFYMNLFNFPQFGGRAFWAVSPIVVSYIAYYAVYIAQSIKSKKIDWKIDFLILVIPVLVFLHIVFFSFHRTLGGHQFGARYTVDVLPTVYLGLLLILKKLPPENKIYLNFAPFLFGLLLNFFGSIMFFLDYFGNNP